MGSGFYQIRRFGKAMGFVFSSFTKPKSERTDGITPLQAVFTALAGTMGTGNIAGVATALVLGGAGAIFWMWVSAVLGMMTKFAEVTLAVIYRRRGENGKYYGGPMVYISEGLGSQFLAVWFSVACICCSFCMGNATQVHSAAAALNESFQIPLVATGLVAAMLVTLVVAGGIKRIGRASELAIPFFSIVYVICGTIVLILNRELLAPAFTSIFTEALSLKSVTGGLGGYTMMTALRAGVARGVFSNEAGLGSAPMAYASADCRSPVEQGYLGIFEVFVDTILVCTFTAMVILSTKDIWLSGADGAVLTTLCFRKALGQVGEYAVTICLSAFAIPTLFCWCYYGERSIRALFGTKNYPVYIYRIIFILVTVVAPTMDLKAIWELADVFNVIMAIPNLVALFALSPQVFAICYNPSE